MTVTTLTSIITSIATGMQGLTGMSATQVSSTSWQIAGNAISCFIAPAFAGREDADTQGSSDGYGVVHRVLVEFTFRSNPNMAAMYTNAATMLERALAWFRANDTLSGSVWTLHAESLTWQATEVRTPQDEIVSKILTFTVPVGLGA